MTDGRDNQLTCLQAQRLLDAYLANDPSLTSTECKALEYHLQHCHDCDDDYNHSKVVIGLIRSYWRPAHQLFPSAEDACSSMTATRAWQHYLRQRPKIAHSYQRQKRIRKFRRLATISAIAASIIIGILAIWNHILPTPLPPSEATTASFTHTAGRQDPLKAFVTLITPSGQRDLPLGHAFHATDKPQEVLLGGMHRVVMNADTSTVFSAESVDIDTERRARYAIQLSKGEIYVEVVPGHPFEVKTNNALLNITGTKFDVRVDSDKTELTLLKGSVRFSNRKNTEQYVDVQAGRSSSIVNQSLPSPSMPVDALAVTAWARDFLIRCTLAQVQPTIEEDLLESIRESYLQPLPPSPENIDYETWRDERKNWFQQTFPWIFRIQDYLKGTHGIEADYIDLLMISGDVWQFRHSHTWHAPFATFKPSFIQQIADYYSLDATPLLQIVDPKFSNQRSERHPLSKDSNSNEDTFISNMAAREAWGSSLQYSIDVHGEVLYDSLFFSLRATAYLTNTQTAAYLWIKAKPDAARLLNRPDDKGASRLCAISSSPEILMKQLLDDINGMNSARQIIQELFIIPQTAGCQRKATSLTKQLYKYISIDGSEDK